MNDDDKKKDLGVSGGCAHNFIVHWNMVQERVHRNAVSHGWWEWETDGGEAPVDVDLVNHGEKIALMHSELSEALEALRKDLNDRHLPERKGVEVELADVVIRIMDYAGATGLDVAGAIVAKHRINIDRPHKHGGKKF